ncbi:WD40 repeat domain-containing protein [Amycolatopsis sp. CA-128772]|uniref:WD40 repeat domain-containing protein n=1 Tax=Amycolatopsis sp. CA-128772 TaxID=2073159 RepID=UPI000CD209C5|nr:WD40 repeat domain-containing protein [Amycolatopsis sp. CA-128772]
MTLADDEVVRRWRVPGPVISGARDSIFAVSFDSTGTKLGVGPGSDDNTLSVWNVADRLSPSLGTMILNDSPAGKFSGSGTLTPDARTFIVGCTDGTVQIWDIENPSHPRLLGAPVAASTGQELVEAVNLSRDGRLLAVSADDESVSLFALTDARSLRPISRISQPGAIKFYQTAFSPDGQMLSGAAEDGHVYVWDIHDTAHPLLLSTLGGFTAAAYSVGFSPQGNVLAAGSADNTVRLWGMADPLRPVVLGRPVTGPVGYIYSLAFDPAGATLATGSTDNTVWLWDVRYPEKPLRLATLTGPTQGVLSVAFAPDGRTLAAGGHDRMVRLWVTDPEWMAHWVCETAGAPITDGEWDKYVPGRPFSPPCR